MASEFSSRHSISNPRALAGEEAGWADPFVRGRVRCGRSDAVSRPQVFGLLAVVCCIADAVLIYRKLLFNPSGPYQKKAIHDEI